MNKTKSLPLKKHSFLIFCLFTFLCRHKQALSTEDRISPTGKSKYTMDGKEPNPNSNCPVIVTGESTVF